MSSSQSEERLKTSQDSSMSMSEEEYDKEFERIVTQQRRAFVAVNPFPSYAAINTAMEAFVSNPTYPAENRRNVMEWMSEFNESYHPHIRPIYEAVGLDKNMNRAFGRLLDRSGGMAAMQGNFYILCNFTPTSRKNVNDADGYAVRGLWKELEYDWDGIGEWKA